MGRSRPSRTAPARKAVALAAEYCPGAAVHGDWAAIVADPTIDVVDATLHPEDRLPVIEAAIRAGKHVLSQKPFVTDLDEGARLADMADAAGVRLAVNQNGRWAPHMAWMRAAVRAGLVGEVISVHSAVHWDHDWVAGTAFGTMGGPDPLRFRHPLVRLPRLADRPLRRGGVRHARGRARPAARGLALGPGDGALSGRPGEPRLRRRGARGPTLHGLRGRPRPAASRRTGPALTSRR